MIRFLIVDELPFHIFQSRLVVQDTGPAAAIVTEHSRAVVVFTHVASGVTSLLMDCVMTAFTGTDVLCRSPTLV